MGTGGGRAVLTTVLSVPNLHTVLLGGNAMDPIIWLVPIPVAVLILRAVSPLQGSLLENRHRLSDWLPDQVPEYSCYSTS